MPYDTQRDLAMRPLGLFSSLSSRNKSRLFSKLGMSLGLSQSGKESLCIQYAARDTA